MMNRKLYEAITFSRREFMAAAGIGSLAAILAAQGKDLLSSSGTVNQGQQVLAVFQEMAYLDRSGNVPVYEPPRRSKSTLAYLAGLSEEEFLKRHYYG